MPSDNCVFILSTKHAIYEICRGSGVLSNYAQTYVLLQGFCKFLPHKILSNTQSGDSGTDRQTDRQRDMLCQPNVLVFCFVSTGLETWPFVNVYMRDLILPPRCEIFALLGCYTV